jgi:hypothetical protein
VECGQPDLPDGTAHALAYVETCLNLESFANLPDSAIADINLFHTVAIVKIPSELNFSFSTNPNDDITFPAAMDELNFCELPAGKTFGKVKNQKAYLWVVNEQGEDVGDRFFETRDGEIILKKSVIPSMISLNPKIVRQDCLCYLMERM